MKELNLELYLGNGVPIDERGQELPGYEPLKDFEHAGNYIAGKGLRRAVNVALALGQPLLVTGEPGTGKTQLAASIAHELKLPLLKFFTKTSSTAVDLFYRYDALRRFHDAHMPESPGSPGKKSLTIDDYIEYQALGQAILLTRPAGEVEGYWRGMPQDLRVKMPTRSVVLIDEIDKAPRDLPNDVLDEVENLRFEVKETGETFTAAEHLRPIVVLTSNSEKNLPDAFLRRCIFYHIPFPSREELTAIVQKRFAPYRDFTPGHIEAAVEVFLKVRGVDLKKKPATAEFLGWLQVLQALRLEPGDIQAGKCEALALSLSILAKTREDLDTLEKFLDKTRDPGAKG